MKRTLTTLTVATMVLGHASLASACPLCKYALESNDSEPLAYMVSILFMMGTITTLFLSVAGMLWWMTKQEKKNLTAAGYEHIFENAGNFPHLANVKVTQ